MLTGGFINRIFLTALLGGVIAGIVLAGVQHFTIVPMILEAETFEIVGAADDTHNHADHNHEEGVAAEEAWAPQDGIERTVSTFVNSTIVGIGFAFLLVACLALQKNVSWRKGILWGLGGFVAIHLAPAIGLPPELPGAAAAELGARQEWWLLTVGLTSGGLLMLVLFPGAAKWSGLLLIALPHILGAPQPENHVGLAPANLEHAFIVASLITNAIFWIVLGFVTAYLYRRFEPTAKPDRHESATTV